MFTLLNYYCYYYYYYYIGLVGFGRMTLFKLFIVVIEKRVGFIGFLLFLFFFYSVWRYFYSLIWLDPKKKFGFWLLARSCSFSYVVVAVGIVSVVVVAVVVNSFVCFGVGIHPPKRCGIYFWTIIDPSRSSGGVAEGSSQWSTTTSGSHPQTSPSTAAHYATAISSSLFLLLLSFF